MDPFLDNMDRILGLQLPASSRDGRSSAR
ncbi:rCG43789 [Rattus norvegicus]|uniref:RCG43789 n=1 Tax=Rattus norvegicus TaxID=10116 RepID=A6KRY0_RAT|nr:rCG43789 [Rattus norvegicus]